MGKKRKASGRTATANVPKEFDPEDGKLGPIDTYEDVADSEDEFHINRDKILLDEGPDAKRRRKWEEEGEPNLRVLSSRLLMRFRCVSGAIR